MKPTLTFDCFHDFISAVLIIVLLIYVLGNITFLFMAMEEQSLSNTLMSEIQILVCRPEEVKRITSIIRSNCPPLESCLSEDKNGMTHAIMEVVAGGIVQTANDIHRYVKCTLLNSTKPFDDVVKSAQDSLRWLCHKRFLEWNNDTKIYSTTPLGRAAFGSSLNPEESLVGYFVLLYFRLPFHLILPFSISHYRLCLMIFQGQEKVLFWHLICI